MRRAVKVTAVVTGLLAGGSLNIPASARGPGEENAPLCALVQRDQDLADGMRNLQLRMNHDIESLLQKTQSSALSPQHFIALPTAAPTPGTGPAPATAPAEKVTYLGVLTSKASPTLQAQLKLPAGVGLVVDFVEKGSPADAAGLKVTDIVTKFDDQLLMNQDQFTTLVRMKKEAQDVPLTIIRAGQTTTLTATLAAKEMPLPTTPAGPGAPNGQVVPVNAGGFLPEGFQPSSTGEVPGWGFKKTVASIAADGTVSKKLIDSETEVDLTKSPAGDIRILIKDNAGKELFSGAYNTDDDKSKIPAPLLAKVRDLDEHVTAKTATPVGPPPTVLHTGTTGHAAMMTRSDGDTLITLRLDATGEHATVTDAHTGAPLFNGPLDTPDQRATLPKPLLEKITSMETHLGITPPAPPAPK